MSVLYDVEEEKKYVFTKKIECTNCGAQFNDLRILKQAAQKRAGFGSAAPVSVC